MTTPALVPYATGEQNELGDVNYSGSGSGTITINPTAAMNALVLLLNYNSTGPLYPSTLSVTSPHRTWTQLSNTLSGTGSGTQTYTAVYLAGNTGALTAEVVTITPSGTVPHMSGSISGLSNSGGANSISEYITTTQTTSASVVYSTTDPNALVIAYATGSNSSNGAGTLPAPFTLWESTGIYQYTPGTLITNSTATATFSATGNNTLIVFSVISPVVLANSAGSFAVSGKASLQGLGTPLSSTSFVFNGDAATLGQATPISPGAFAFTGEAVTTTVVGSTVVGVTSLDKRFRRPPLNPNSFAKFGYNTGTLGNQLNLQPAQFAFTGQPTNLVALTNFQVSALEHNRSARPPNNLNLFRTFPYNTYIPRVIPVYQVSSLNNLGPRTPPFNLNLFNSFGYSTAVNSTILVTYPGAFAVTGQPLTIGNTGVLLPVLTGSFAFTGAPLTFQVDTPISLGSASFAFAGDDAQLISVATTGVTPYLLADEAIFGGAFGGPLELVEFVYLPERQPFLEGATNLIIDRYLQEPTDVRQRGVDYTFFLVPGEILTNVVVEGISAQGVLQANTNPLVTPLVVSGITIDSTGVKFAYTVSGGQDGIEYTVQFTTTTTLQTSNVEEIFSINVRVEDSFP